MMRNQTYSRLKIERDQFIKDPSHEINAYPLKEDIFTWHFTIKGVKETEFEGGFYHGVIKLPTKYPYEPPSIMFLNPSGRFEVNMDVCLSVTRFHKEEWQAAWTSKYIYIPYIFLLVRTILQAIAAFFQVKEDTAAIGALNYPKETRQKLAIQSQKYKCEICGLIKDTIMEKKDEEKVEKQDGKQAEKEGKEEENYQNIKDKINKKSYTKIKSMIVEENDEYEDKDKEESEIKIKRTESLDPSNNLEFTESLRQLRLKQFANYKNSTQSEDEVKRENEKENYFSIKSVSNKSLSELNIDSKEGKDKKTDNNKINSITNNKTSQITLNNFNSNQSNQIENKGNNTNDGKIHENIHTYKENTSIEGNSKREPNNKYLNNNIQLNNEELEFAEILFSIKEEQTIKINLNQHQSSSKIENNDESKVTNMSIDGIRKFLEYEEVKQDKLNKKKVFLYKKLLIERYNQEKWKRIRICLSFMIIIIFIVLFFVYSERGREYILNLINSIPIKIELH